MQNDTAKHIKRCQSGATYRHNQWQKCCLLLLAWDVITAFAAIEKVRLSFDEGKTNYMVSKGKESNRTIGSHINAGTYNFEVVEELIYLGGAVKSQNDVSSEILRWITVANRCYYGLSKQLCSRALSRKIKPTLYKTLLPPVLLYGAETWVLTDKDKQALGVFERTILRKMFGAIKILAEYRKDTTLSCMIKLIISSK